MLPHQLATFKFPYGASMAQAMPQPRPRVTPESPAVAAMTDLTQVPAASVRTDATLDQAELKMIHYGVRLLFVSDNMPQVVGVVTAASLQGEAPMRLVHDRGLHRDEISVADVMTPLSALDVVDLTTVRGATIADIVETMQHLGRSHLLVLEPATTAAPAQVRGVISMAQIERQLGERVPVMDVARTFSELTQALR